MQAATKGTYLSKKSIAAYKQQREKMQKRKLSKQAAEEE